MNGKRKAVDDNYEQLIINLEKSIENNSIKIVDSDYDLNENDIKSLSEHNNLYTQLLKEYVQRFTESSKIKRKYRKVAFWVFIVLLVVSTIVTFVILGCSVFFSLKSKLDISSSLTAVISTLVSSICSFIVIPKIIVEYLFDKEEEKNLTEVIGRIQEYDSRIRKKN